MDERRKSWQRRLVSQRRSQKSDAYRYYILRSPHFLCRPENLLGTRELAMSSDTLNALWHGHRLLQELRSLSHRSTCERWSGVISEKTFLR